MRRLTTPASCINRAGTGLDGCRITAYVEKTASFGVPLFGAEVGIKLLTMNVL